MPYQTCFFGGKDIRIEIGSGKKLFKIGFLQINSIFFWSGRCGCSRKHFTKIQRIIVLIGGPLGNVLTMVIIYLALTLMNLDVTLRVALNWAFIYNIWTLVTALLPIKDDYTSDGYRIMEKLREGSESH